MFPKIKKKYQSIQNSSLRVFPTSTPLLFTKKRITLFIHSFLLLFKHTYCILFSVRLNIQCNIPEAYELFLLMLFGFFTSKFWSLRNKLLTFLYPVPTVSLSQIHRKLLIQKFIFFFLLLNIVAITHLNRYFW